MLEYLQVMIFANLFAITSNPQYVQDIKELVLSLLEDDQLEASLKFTQFFFISFVEKEFMSVVDRILRSLCGHGSGVTL